MIAAKDTMNFVNLVEDEFREKPFLQRALGTAGVVAGTAGLGIVIGGVFAAL